jgi:hypothetical protein
VGYCGGTTASPTYYSLGDHSEAIQIDFDSSQIRYDQLLAEALAQGNFSQLSSHRQYRSAVFYHTPAQREAAQRAGIRSLEPLGSFTRAEDYHQKYYLQQSRVAADFYAMFPTTEAFTDATTVARANAVVGGHVTRQRLEAWLPAMGLSQASAQILLRSSREQASPGCAVPGS